MTLQRYFGGAFLDEYYCNGVWDMELLALDMQLLQAHHKLCGAPYLQPLEAIPEVVFPEVCNRIGMERGTVSSDRIENTCKHMLYKQGYEK